MKAFKTRKHCFVWPIILTCLNLPPEMRFKKRNVLVAGFIPAPTNPKDTDSFFKPLVDEFKMLSHEGIPNSWDAGADMSERQTFTMRTYLMIISTEMSACPKGLKTMGFKSSSCYEYCQIHELNYGGMHIPHKPPNNLDKHPWIVEVQLNKIDEGRPCYNWKKNYTAANSTLRTHEDFRRVGDYVSNLGNNETNEDRLETSKVSERTGIAGRSIFMKLRSISFPFSFPPCSMHLFYENVFQTVFEHYDGRFLVKRQTSASPPTDQHKDGEAAALGP